MLTTQRLAITFCKRFHNVMYQRNLSVNFFCKNSIKYFVLKLELCHINQGNDIDGIRTQ